MSAQKKIPGDIDSLLSEVNRFGAYQAVQCCLVLLPVVFTAMSNGNFVFTAAKVQYRCKVPACEDHHATAASSPEWWPSSVHGSPCRQPVLMRNLTDAPCNAKDFSDQTVACEAWVYETGNSIVSEFELACKEWQRSLVGTVHNIGVLISMPLLGYVSDKWGRRTAVIISAVGSLLGAVKVLAAGPGLAGYPLFIAFELIEATVNAATFVTCFVLLVELIGQANRTISALIIGLAIASGEMSLALLAWALPHWSHILLAIHCPAILFASYIFLLDESPRWLLVNGRNDDALRVVQRIAKWNGLQVTDDTLVAIQKGVICNEGTATEAFSLKLLVSSPVLLKRLVICSWWWIAVALVHYGLLITSVALPGDKYANFVLAAAIAVPGDFSALFSLKSFGRKKTLFFGFFFCGLCCVASGFVPDDYPVLQILVFLSGKLLIGMCFNAVYVYTSELVPTSVRSTLVGVCSMLARVGSTLAPLSPLLVSIWRPLPSVLFGVSALGGALLTLSTPETSHLALPDTVAQTENKQDSKC